MKWPVDKPIDFFGGLGGRPGLFLNDFTVASPSMRLFPLPMPLVNVFLNVIVEVSDDMWQTIIDETDFGDINGKENT